MSPLPGSIGLPHTAIASWSGFVYQGKVAIYHVLKLLNNPSTCNGFTLQLDSLEDFAILDDTPTIVSMHQVKAIKTQLFSGYCVAFEKLKEKAGNYTCNQAFFHTSREITDTTVDEIENQCVPVKIYKYAEIPYCAVNEIDKEIEGQLRIIFSGNEAKTGNGYLSLTRQYLDQIVLKKILDVHRIIHDNLASGRQAAFDQTIPFSEFKDILDCDLNEKNKKEDGYYFYVLLNDMHKYYQNYCIENPNDTEGEMGKKLSEYMGKIGDLDETSITNFIQNIIPHRKFKFDSLSEYKDHTFNDTEFQNAFLEILRRLKKTQLNPKNFFQWKKGNMSFTPTAINEGSSQTKRICQRIIDNAFDNGLEIIYEGNNLITADITAPSITEEAPRIIQPDGEENGLMGLKRVSLISLTEAEAIINV